MINGLNKKIRGFIGLDAIISLIFFAGAVTALGYYINESNKNEQAKELAAQTLSYAKLYGKFLQDTYAQQIYVMDSGIFCHKYEPFISGNTQFFSLNDLKSSNYGSRYSDINYPYPAYVTCNKVNGSYYNQSLSGINRYTQKPCLGVTVNQAGKYQAFLYWVATNNSSATPIEVSRKAANLLGGKGGYFDAAGNMHSNGGWKLSSGDPRFANPGQCGGAMVARNTLVLNMDDFIEYNNGLSDSPAIYRESDTRFPKGDPLNKNTAKTDIYLSSNNQNHSVILNLDSQVSLTAESGTNNVIVKNGNLNAGSIVAYQKVKSGSLCSKDEVGQIAQQNDPEAVTYKIQQSDLVCSDSSLVCSLYGGQYCWVPVKGQTISYKDSIHTGWMGQGFICPAYAPFLQNATAYQQGNPKPQLKNIISKYQNFTLIRGASVTGLTPGTSCTYHYSVDMCSGHASGDYQCTTVTGSSPPPAITKPDGYQGGTCGGGKYQQIPGWGGCPWGGAFETSKSCTTIGKAVIDSATCTSKLTLQAN